MLNMKLLCTVSHFRTCMDIIGRADIFMFIYVFYVVLVYL